MIEKIEHRTNRWFSIYIYYDNVNEYLKTLQSIIIPIINNVDIELAIQGYFFIRYWEDGYHVRLRILTEDRAKVEANVLTHLRINHNECKYKIVPYIPEVNRYGGDYYLIISEKHFQYSSSTAYNILNDIKNNLDKYTIVNAIYMQYVLTLAFDFSIYEMVEYYKMLFKYWSIHRIGRTHEQTATLRVIDIKNEYLNNYGNSILSLANNLTLLKNSIDLDSIDYNLGEWFLKCKETKMDFDKLTKSGLNINCDRVIVLDNGDNLINHYWNILESYSHMINNRMGVINNDESLIFFLLYKSLEKLI